MDLTKSLSGHADDLGRCARCSLCKYPPLAQIKSKRFSLGCPAVGKYAFHGYSSGGKMILGLALLEGRIDVSEELREIVYRCSTCGSCDVSCKYNRDLEPLEYIFALRAELIARGAGPMPAHEPILKSIRNYDNVWMQPKKARARWAAGLPVKDASAERFDVLYFAGCSYALKPELRAVPRNLVGLMLKAGLTVGIFGEREPCCGSPAFTLGDRELFRQCAEKNLDLWERAGVRTVVVSCAGCYGLMRAKYPLVRETGIEVLSAPEMAARLIARKRLRPAREVRRKVTYHDPCHLGRQSEKLGRWSGRTYKALNQCVVQEPKRAYNRGANGIYDAPRQVLRAIPGLEFREMERIREYSFCCGSGGGVKSAFPEMALWAAGERLEEAACAGADELVTSCPWCETNFADAAARRANGGKPFPVTNLFELLTESVGGV